MRKKERYNYYKHLQGLGVWDMGSTDENFRSFVVNDGPLGVRKPSVDSFSNQAGVLTSVCLIAPSSLAASFSKKTAYRNGELLALDCINKKTDVLLAPGINIKRNALCGRNFEYFSEDPYLTGILASEYINGLENNGVGSCVKHYLANNKEHGRLINDSIMSIEALNNIYLRNFYYVMKYSKPSTIMTSYNLVNGEYVSESEYLLKTKLRNQFGFEGLIMSDWCAINNKAKSIHAGMNVEMPISKRTFDSIDEGFENIFTEDDLIERDEEILKVQKKFQSSKKCSYDFDKIHEEAVDLACETFVLLKNENNFLPFSKDDKIVVIGQTAQNPVFQGGGSAEINVYKSINFLDALKNKNKKYIHFNEVTNNEVELKKLAEEGYKFILMLSRPIKFDSENSDRTTLDLENSELKVFDDLVKVNAKFATIIETGSVVNIENIYKYSNALLISYRAGEGQEEGLVNTVFGQNNPSGKLPETWISSLSDNIIYEDINKRNPYYTYYHDDIYCGYRYYDLKEPKHFYLPFGYGLSYSTFEYSNFSYRLEDNKIIFSLKITNTSDFDGKDTLLVFSSLKESNVYRAKKDLVGFEKIYVKAHSTSIMEIMVNLDDLSIYDKESDLYKVEKGKYTFGIYKDSNNKLKSFDIEIDGEDLKENKVITKLIEKPDPIKFSINTPIFKLFDSEEFLKLAKEYGMNFTLEEFKANYMGMAYEPFRSLTYRDELNIDFDFINRLISILNKD